MEITYTLAELTKRVEQARYDLLFAEIDEAGAKQTVKWRQQLLKEAQEALAKEEERLSNA